MRGGGKGVQRGFLRGGVLTEAMAAGAEAKPAFYTMREMKKIDVAEIERARSGENSQKALFASIRFPERWATNRVYIGHGHSHRLTLQTSGIDLNLSVL
jgi:hypothetical protein